MLEVYHKVAAMDVRQAQRTADQVSSSIQMKLCATQIRNALQQVLGVNGRFEGFKNGLLDGFCAV